MDSTPCSIRKAGPALRLIALVPLAIAGGLAFSCGDTEVVFDDTPAPPLATATVDVETLGGFVAPIAGACLPEADRLMPNAARDYRSGTHEGVDFYNFNSCVTIEMGTPVRAVLDGVVARADHDYHRITAAELAEANRRIEAGEANAFEIVDLFRGMQVWIDQGGGIVTRYAHLSGIPNEITEGARVAQGQTVGFVGDSGTPESINSPGAEAHLHWEVRIGDSFLGRGLPPEEVRRLYTNLFARAAAR